MFYFRKKFYLNFFVPILLICKFFKNVIFKSMIRKRVLSLLGNEPLDVGILNGQLINVYTDEIVPNIFIGIKGDRIVYVGDYDKELADRTAKIIDANNRFISPGFIETHTHIAQICNLSDFSEVSLHSGTTTVITESAEFANSFGKEAIKHLLNDIKLQPVRLYITLPPLTPPFPEFETSIGLNFEDYKELLYDERVMGLGEFYWSRILDFKDFYEKIIKNTLDIGKTVHGHSSGAKGKKLNAYISMGIKSCHEPITVKEVIERVRLGLHVVLREGSVRCDFSNVYGFKDILKDYRMVSISTDGATPLLLKEKGTLNHIAKKAVKLGFSPVDTVKMLTINASYVFNMQDKVGAVAPGKFADIVIFNNLESFNVDTVLVGGDIKILNNKNNYKKIKYNYPSKLRKSVKIDSVTPEDFKYFSKIGKYKVKVRVLKYLEFLLTGIEDVELEVDNDCIKIDKERNILKHLIFERYGSGRIVKGFIKDLGFKNYTFACSINWEANQVIVIGADDVDLSVAVNRIVDNQGGIVLVKNGEIVEEIPLPICGVMSELPLEVLAEKEANINKLLIDDGCRMDNPFLWLQTLSFTGLPYYKLTDKGLVDVRKNKIIEIIKNQS